MNPGATALTRMPWTISSLATDRVKPRIARLRRGVVRVPGAALDPADRRHVHDRARSARPPSPAPRRGCRRTSRRGGPTRTSRHSSSVSRTSASSGVCALPSAAISSRWRSSSGVTRWTWSSADRPALLTKISSGPSSCSICSTARSTCRLSDDVDLEREARADRVDRPLGAREREVENRDRCPFAGEAVADRLADPAPPPVTAATLPSNLDLPVCSGRIEHLN